MRYQPPWLAGAGLVAIGLAVAVALAASGPASGGPLAKQVPPNAVTFSVDPGVAFTYGGVQLRNPGTGTAVLEGVRLVDATSGLRIVSAYVLPIPAAGGDLWFSYESYPPPGIRDKVLEPLAGYRIAPGAAEVQLLLALAVPEDGVFEFRRVAVAYRAQGRRYEATLPFAMRVCAPMVDLEECPKLMPAATLLGPQEGQGDAASRAEGKSVSIS